MRKRIFIPLILAMVAVFSLADPAKRADDPPKGDEESLVFVYLHGFGGVEDDPEFCENLSRFLSRHKVSAEVVNYEWDSVEVDVLRAASSWEKSQESADAEAPRYRKSVIEKLESEGRPYVLIGFSVGSRVVLKALESTTSELKGLKGVYFLGSALDRKQTLKNRNALPGGMKIVNYHSPLRDVVHLVSFNLISDVPGGGQVGFDDDEVFENFAVSCAHAHKGMRISADYSGLAEGIAYLELYKQGVVVPGRTKLNWESAVMEGDLWWNKLAIIDPEKDGSTAEVELEQHVVRHGYYRAVKVGENGKRTRVARGDNLHAILGALEVPPGEGR